MIEVSAVSRLLVAAGGIVVTWLLIAWAMTT
jgi:hypothetical protein